MKSRITEPTLKSILPFPSLSKILKIWSTKTEAFPSGMSTEYISSTFSFLNLPLGQSFLKPLQTVIDYKNKKHTINIIYKPEPLQDLLLIKPRVPAEELHVVLGDAQADLPYLLYFLLTLQRLNI